MNKQKVMAKLGIWPFQIIGIRQSDGCAYPTVGTIIAFMGAGLVFVVILNLLRLTGLVHFN